MAKAGNGGPLQRGAPELWGEACGAASRPAWSRRNIAAAGWSGGPWGAVACLEGGVWLHATLMADSLPCLGPAAAPLCSKKIEVSKSDLRKIAGCLPGAGLNKGGC